MQNVTTPIDQHRIAVERNTSELHALSSKPALQRLTIQRRHANFVLADKSTNGTFVTVEGEEEVVLHREEITLRKSGWICFGQSRSAAGDDVMEFVCD